MNCPRCQGYVVADEDPSCLNCGWRDVGPPSDLSPPNGHRIPGVDRGRPKAPPPKGFSSGTRGFCVNGHGFRSVAHRECLAQEVAV